MEVRRLNNLYNPVNYNGYYKKKAYNENVVEGIGAENTKLNGREKIEEELIKSIEEANEHVLVYDRRFEFSIHEKTKQIMVKVVDVTTEEIIREIPPEKILDLIAALWELSGLFVDERI
ncbi:MAG: flagellar protein FlaG [Tissierellia bacterium]|nr:flagellar protein FlaG [Tissierellia bacterium]